jgi:hypothetical protein
MKLLQFLKYVITEQNQEDDVDITYGQNIGRISPFNISPSATAEAMKTALKKYGKDFQKVGSNRDFTLPGVDPNEEYKPESVERFLQWYSDVIANPDSVTFRGKAFEGLIAGIFDGIVTNNETSDKSDKTDVKVGNQNISVKFREKFDPNKSMDLGGVASAFDRYFKDENNRKKFPNVEFPNRITADKLGQFIRNLSNNTDVDLLKNTLFTILNNSQAFGPINWFIFSTLDSRNEIRVYQYRQEDIIRQIIDEIINDNAKIYGGMLGVQNLSQVPTSIFRIKFPQYLKNVQRYRYNIKKNENRGDYNERFVIVDQNSDEVVGIVKKKYEEGEPNYYIEKLNKYANITKEMKLEAMNAYVLRDINGLQNKLEELEQEREQKSGSGSRVLKQEIDKKISTIKNLLNIHKQKSVQLGRELVNEKNKLYGTGVEQDLQNVFGSRGETMSPFILQQIRKNPDRFFRSFLKVYKENPKRMNNFEKIFNQIKQE